MTKVDRTRKQLVGVPLDPEDRFKLQVLSEAVSQSQAALVRTAIRRFFAELDEERGLTPDAPEIPSVPTGKGRSVPK